MLSFNYYLKKYWENTRGGIAVQFAICTVPLLLTAGIAVDYTTAVRTQSRLQEAADSAVMAGAVIGQTGANRKKQKREARNFFNSNCDDSYCKKISSKKITVKGGKVHMEVVADSPVSFLQLAGISAFPVKVVAEVALEQSNAGFIDVYFLVDVTGSMNIADGQSEITKLQNLYNPYNGIHGCAFACHRVTGGLDGYQIAVKNRIYLREDRVRDELSDLARKILTNPSVKSRVGIHTFTWGIQELIKPVHQNGQAQKAIAKIFNNSGGTNIQQALNEMELKLPDSGTGASANNPKIILVLITDGMTMNFNAIYEPLKTAACDKIKAKDISLFVLNIEYPDLDMLKDDYNTSVIAARRIIDDIEAPLEACASKDRYYKGKFGKSVSDAFDEILGGLKKETAKSGLHFTL